MVFQEPMTALNPTHAGRRPGRRGHADPRHPAGPPAAPAPRAVELLDRVGLPDPGDAARAYPHQLSGGQRQRVVLAIALANDPALLICDEPTTALDVTVQAQVLDLIVRGVAARDAALLFITHDLAVVASVCERVLVMYGGRVVEAGPVARGLHPARGTATPQGLLAASDLDAVDERGRLPDDRRHRARRPASSRPGASSATAARTPPTTCEQVPPLDRAPTRPRGYACHHPVERDRTAEAESRG